MRPPTALTTAAHATATAITSTTHTAVTIATTAHATTARTATAIASASYLPASIATSAISIATALPIFAFQLRRSQGPHATRSRLATATMSVRPGLLQLCEPK